jgi:hypothetical protein
MSTVYLCASIIFVLLAVAAIGCLWLAHTKPATPGDNAIRLYKPCKQRRETLKRATQNARLLVAGGTIDIPKRRV